MLFSINKFTAVLALIAQTHAAAVDVDARLKNLEATVAKLGKEGEANAAEHSVKAKYDDFNAGTCCSYYARTGRTHWITWEGQSTKGPCRPEGDYDTNGHKCTACSGNSGFCGEGQWCQEHGIPSTNKCLTLPSPPSPPPPPPPPIKCQCAAGTPASGTAYCQKTVTDPAHLTVCYTKEEDGNGAGTICHKDEPDDFTWC